MSDEQNDKELDNKELNGKQHDSLIPVSSLMLRLPKVRGSYREMAELGKINWFQVGGPAEILFRPADVEDLAFFLENCPEDIPVTILGVGSNLLVRDGGIDGVVVRLGKGFTDIFIHHNDQIVAGAGALSFNVSHFAKNCGLAGAEFLVGIPGTIGGALAMNSGAYQQEISDILVEAEAVSNDGQVHKLSKEDFGFVYRGHTLPEGMIFTKAILQLKPGNKSEIHQRMEEITEKRASTQPVRSRTSGSTFKNPPGHSAWKLIDDAGCRGLKKGDAQVSEMHCNFFINNGNATATDLESLGEEVRQKVKQNSGVDLEWEVQIIGKPLQ